MSNLHPSANESDRTWGRPTDSYSHFSGAQKARPAKYGAKSRPGSQGQPESNNNDDWEAVHEMFLTSRPKLVRQAYSILGNREDAEDAVQDAFLSAHRHLHAFEGRSAFATWFTRIVFNAALMIRRKRRSSRLDPVPESTASNDTSWIERIPASEPDPETVYVREQTAQFFRGLVEKMSPMLREAFTLTYYKELSCVEAAAQLGVKPTAFKARLFRARHYLIKQATRSLVASGRRKATHSSRFPRNDEIQAFPATLTETLPSERAFFMTEPIQSVPSSQGSK